MIVFFHKKMILSYAITGELPMEYLAFQIIKDEFETSHNNYFNQTDNPIYSLVLTSLHLLQMVVELSP